MLKLCRVQCQVRKKRAMAGKMKGAMGISRRVRGPRVIDCLQRRRSAVTGATQAWLKGIACRCAYSFWDSTWTLLQAKAKTGLAATSSTAHWTCGQSRNLTGGD